MDRRDRTVLATLVAVSAVVYAVHSIVRHAVFQSDGYDLGIFDQAMRGYASFGAPTSSLKGGVNLLGNHFHPILVVLTPLYWIWDDPRMLLLAQAVLVASSIVPVYLMARARLGRWTTALVATGYAFGWPVQALVDFDFHEVAFALPLLAWTLYLVDRERYRAAVLTSLLLLLVREDMGLVLVAIAAVLAIRKQWAEAAVTAAVGLGGYYLVTDVVIPALAPDLGFQYWSYDALGKDLPSALRAMVTDPLRAIRLFFGPTKGRTVFLLLLQSGMVCVLSPYVLPAVPLAAQRFLSSRENLWNTEFHYNAPIAVVLVAGLVDVLGRLRPVSERVPPVMAGSLVALAFAGMVSLPPIFAFGELPGRIARLDGERVRDTRNALAEVPHGVCVEADNQLAPHLTATNDVTLPGMSNGRASWLLLDLSKPDVGGDPPALPPDYYVPRALDAGFLIRGHHGSIWILHRPGGDARTCFG